MKKLMVAIAAVASAFGLYADGQALNAAFVADNETSGQFAPAAPGWVAYTGDASKLIITEDNPKMLDISTGTAALKRNVANDGAAWVLDPETKKNLYFDTTIDFKGQVLDDVPDVTGGKLAIFALDGTEIDGLADGTNVYVYAGYGTESKALFRLAGFDEEFPAENIGHRIVVKTWANVFSAGTRSGFILYIQNGEAKTELVDTDIAKVIAAYTYNESTSKWTPIDISEDGAYLGDVADSIDGSLGKWVAQKSLFMNLDINAETTEQFTTLDFQGNAKIAGVNITDVAPVTFPADSFSMDVEADVNFTILPATVKLMGNKLVSPIEQSVTITPVAKDILVVKKGEQEIENVNGTFTFDFSDGDTLYVHGADKKATVTIDNVDYPCESIADAIAMLEGQAGKVTLNAAITIGDEDDFTFAGTDVILDLAGKTVTIDGESKALANTGKLTVIDSIGGGVVNGNTENYGDLTIEAGEFTGLIAAAKDQIEVVTAITGGKFNAGINNGDDCTIETTGGNFLASVFGTKTENTIPGIQDGYVVVDDQLANYLTVVVAPKNYVAQINDGEKYESLKAAVEAAKGGDTINILANCDVPETICFYNTGTNVENQITLKNDYHVELTTAGNYSFYIVNANVKVTGTGMFSKTNGVASAFVVGSSEKPGLNGRPAKLGYGILDFEGNLTGGIEELSGPTDYSDAPSGMIKVEAGFCNFVGGSVINWRSNIKSGAYQGKCVSASYKKYTDIDHDITNDFEYVGVVTIQAGTFRANTPLERDEDATLKIIGKDNTAKVRPLDDTRVLNYSAFCEPGYTFLKVTDDQDQDYQWYKIGMNTFSITVTDGAEPGASGTADPATFNVEAIFPLEVALTKPTAPEGKEFDSWSANVGTIDDAKSTLTIDAFPNEDVVVTVVWKDILVTSVELNKDKLELDIGAAETLTATVLPADAADKTIAWTSSDEAIATVVDGEVTAVAEGTATITATNAASGLFATCTVTVKSAGPAPINPDEPSAPIAADTAEDAIKAVQVARPAAVESYVDATTYDSYFVKTAKEVGTKTWEVTATLDPDIVKAEKETEVVAGKLSDLSVDNATIEITTAKPGLYYTLKQGGTVELGGTPETKLAETTSVSFDATHYDGAGFYKVVVSTKAE